MKKILATILLALSLMSFAACGSGYAKITGIEGGIISPDESDFYNSVLSDDSTLYKNDYVLKVGEQYQLIVRLTFDGGSRMPVFENGNGIKLVYDSNLLQIGEPSTVNGQLIYPLECKKEFINTTILIENAEEYHTEVIASAVK